MIVDSQIHVWTHGRPPQHHWQRAQFTDADVIPLMDAAGVDRAILVPPSWEGYSNAASLQAARSHPERFAVMGRLALDSPDGRKRIASWKSQPGMLGLRFTFPAPERQSLVDGTADWIWPAAEEANLPVMLFLSGAMHLLAGIAERHPDLRLIIDHLGAPLDAKDDAAFADLPNVLALARFNNVAIKVSGVAALSSDPYPYQNTHRYLKEIYDAFGPRRMFWGTDLTRQPATYAQNVRLFAEELPWLSSADKKLVMGEAICEFLGWTTG